MTRQNPSLTDMADDLEQTLVSETSAVSSSATRSLSELFSTKTRELSQTYFNSDFRMRMMQELESR